MKPICPMPWSAFFVKSAGELHPCCTIKEPPGVKYTLQDDGIEAYQSSDFLKELKDTLLSGKMHETMCRDCIDQEDNYIKSFRQHEIDQLEKDFPNYTINDGYVKAQFIFDNTCNLKCIMCDSLYSSKWRQEYKDIYGIDNKPNKTDNKFIREFFEKNFKSLRHIQISGGESFMGPLGLENDFLDIVLNQGINENIDLYIETNGTVYPTQEIISKLLQFKSVKFNMSMDGISKRSEYIRYPSTWQEYESSIKKLKSLVDNYNKFNLGIMHTLSIFNIYYLKEFLDYAKTITDKTHIHMVETPAHFSPLAMPYELRQLVGNKLLKDKNLECMRWGKFLKECNSNNEWEKFLLFKDKHDLYRGTNFAKTFPELEELINGFQ